MNVMPQAQNWASNSEWEKGELARCFFFEPERVQSTRKKLLLFIAVGGTITDKPRITRKLQTCPKIKH
jgi:hypothetical protein